MDKITVMPKEFKYEIYIDAPKQKVWETMIQPDTYKEWTNASWAGSYYEGKWEQGERIKFISKDESGTLALIEVFNPYHYISAKHIAILIKGGKEDAESELAKGWIGTLESYTFQEQDQGTNLIVDIVTNPDWQKMFDDGFPNALKKLKEICEQ